MEPFGYKAFLIFPDYSVYVELILKIQLLKIRIEYLNFIGKLFQSIPKLKPSQ